MKPGFRRLVAIVAVMAGMVAGTACARPPSAPGPAPKDVSFRQAGMPGEYLVTLEGQAGVEAIADIYGRFGIKGIKGLGGYIFLVTLDEDPGPEKMEELGRRDPRIKAVQPNFVYRTGGGGSAP